MPPTCHEANQFYLWSSVVAFVKLPCLPVSTMEWNVFVHSAHCGFASVLWSFVQAILELHLWCGSGEFMDGIILYS